MPKVKIKVSENLKQRLSNLKGPFAKILKDGYWDGIDKSSIKNNYPDYLDFDGNNITYINSNTVSRRNIKNPWSSNTRQKTKAVRVINRIFKNDVLKSKIKQTDIEEFVAQWKASLNKSCKVVEYTGFDILKTFNYTKLINTDKFGTSCANFNHPGNGYPAPMVKWFYFYIYNNPTVKVPCVVEDGLIKARAVTFTGVQQYNSGFFKKGKTYTIMNYIYSEGDSKYKKILEAWANERGILMNNGSHKQGRMIIPIKTHYKTYPPADSVLVDLKNGLLLSKDGWGLDDEYKRKHGDNLREAYKLSQGGGYHLGRNRY